MSYLDGLQIEEEMEVVSDTDVVIGIEYVNEEDILIDLNECLVTYSLLDENKRFLYKDLKFKRNELGDFIIVSSLTKNLNGRFNLKISIEKTNERTSFNILMEVG